MGRFTGLMRNRKTYILLLGILLGLNMACQKLSDQDIYKRPDWLPGKLYTTVSVQDNLSMFAECLRLTGLDSIIDVSGSWTVFAPTNEAMEQFLSENHYSSLSGIPPAKLEEIAKFHIIQNPWSLEQLQTLSAYGWRSRDDNKSNSYAYKRETILKNPNEKYWTKRKDGQDVIVSDSTVADSYKMVFVQSRKYVPIFHDKYVNVNGVTSDDFAFYFNRPYEPGNVYFANAKLLQSDILAENGFVHIVDKVVDPMLNANEMLEREIPEESYQTFLDMVYWYFPSFRPNLNATNSQPAVRLGGIVDTLWDLDYADLAFSIQKEIVGYKGSSLNETLVRHNGMFAPTDENFNNFIDDILTSKSGYPHWKDYKSLPSDVAEIIIGQHFRSNPIYPSSSFYKNIFRGNGGFTQDEESIIRKEFGSNCTFIGINSYKPDRVFTSVTGPVFLRPAFSIFRRALLYARIEDDIAYNNGELYFFPITDGALKSDSSMLLNWIDKDRNQFNFVAYDRTRHQMVTLRSSTIRNLILNHVGTLQPSSSPNIDVIRTLRGNYITWDHTDNSIQGTRSTTIGYNGREVTTNYPSPLDEPAENGKAWSVRSWFNF